MTIPKDVLNSSEVNNEGDALAPPFVLLNEPRD